MPDVEAELQRLEALDLEGLRAAWRGRTNGPAPKLRSVELLRYLLAWDIQSRAFGGLDAEVQLKLRGKAAVTKRPKGPPRGSRLIKEWKGQLIEVDVLEKGYRWKGSDYRSLSEIAREVTGVNWNGPRFFGLRPQRAAT